MMRNEAGQHYPTELALELASKDHVEFLEHRSLLKKAAHRKLFKCTGFGAFSGVSRVPYWLRISSNILL
jgi:hypothetical protein